MLAIVLVQAINFLVPLLVLPHIARTLGVQEFGIYTILLSYSNYVLLISDFSFNVNGPLLVAKARHDGRLGQLAIDATTLKIILLVPALLAFAVASYVVTEQSCLLIMAAAMIPVTTSLTPRWVIYSVGQIYAFAGVSALSKGLWVALIYWLVRTPNDVGLILTLTALTQLLLCIGCTALVWKQTDDRSWPDMQRVAGIFRNDVKQFAALVATAALRDLGVVVLSVTGGSVHVSIYALADRVRFAVMGMVAPVSQSLFLVTTRYSRDGGVQQRVRGFVNIAIMIGAGASGLGIFMFADEVVRILGGAAFSDSARLLRIVAFAPTFSALNSVLGVNTLLAEGLSKEYASAQLNCAFIAGPSLLLLTVLFAATGAAAGILLTEIIFTLLLVHACQRHRVVASAFSVHRV